MLTRSLRDRKRGVPLSTADVYGYVHTHQYFFRKVSITLKIFFYILGGSRDNLYIRFPYWVTVFHTRDGKRIYTFLHARLVRTYIYVFRHRECKFHPWYGEHTYTLQKIPPEVAFFWKIAHQNISNVSQPIKTSIVHIK